MTEFSDVASLLKVDVSTASQAETVFGELGPAMDCANVGLRVFAAAAAWLIKYEENHPKAVEFNKTAGELGISADELWKIVGQPPKPKEDPRIEKARGINSAVDLVVAQRTLLQLLWRAGRWGITDLCRLRLTPAAGYTRIQAESVALMLLFNRKPEYAARWINPSEDSKKFYGDTQSQVKAVAKELNLAQAYDHGSAVAQHARFQSAARGIRIKDGDIEVLDQEFDAEGPVTFHLGLAYFLRMQKRMFEGLAVVFPDLKKDEAFKGALAECIYLEDKTWWVMERKYADEIKEFYIE